jgi:hypothetical protein
MLAKSLLLVLDVNLLAFASPLQVPSHVDLVPRSHSGFKPKLGVETIYESNVSLFVRALGSEDSPKAELLVRLF